MMSTYRLAEDVAKQAAKSQPDDRYIEPFKPPIWVLSALIHMYNEGVLAGRREACDPNRDHVDTEIHGLF